MSATKFTPGPWRCCEADLPPYREVRLGTGNNAVAFDPPMALNEKPRTQAANAHLIAAAPDLYEALDVIVKSVGTADGWDDAIEQAQAALKKARGE